MISALTFFAMSETVDKTLPCLSSKPFFKPKSRYSPISAQTFDGEWMLKMLCKVLVTLRARLLTVDVIDDHILEMPRCKPETRFDPTLVQSVPFMEVFKPSHSPITEDLRPFHAEDVDDCILFHAL